ncbi:MAG TPA: biosynthetic peptidoglycan transglycosylase [Gaiellales bacterium]|nr:biosynthetic peptidoglycan transglycosylase [Gaiellales bacterium]
MADAKPRKRRRWALGTLGLAAVWLLGVWPPPVWWRDHWPRCTAMMRERAECVTVHGTELRDVAPALERMVIIGEDSRFRTHHGIDPAEIADALGAGRGRGITGTIAAAWRQRDRLRGASTITQQLAKNLYLSSSRNPLRKIKEAATAVRLELALPKDRILELYLNLAEWGPDVWGVEAASRAYFGVPPAQLTEEQAAELAATLPHPRSSNPTFRPAATLQRRDLILARYHGVEVYIPPEEEIDSIPVPAVLLPPVDSLRIDSLTARRTDATDAQGRTADSGRDSLP